MGTVSQDATAGTSGDPDGDEPPVRFRGDEADLYLEYNHELVKTLSHCVRGAAEQDIEDAAAFAWVQFFRYQPDRDREWQAWLFKTAQREAWRLTARRGRELRVVPEISDIGPADPDPLADPADRLQHQAELKEALNTLKLLPKRMQQVVLVRSQVQFQREVAEILGITTGRVDYLLASTAPTLRRFAEKRMERERDRPLASPRAARLRELEDEPPEWLVEAIGPVPMRGKNAGPTVLAWRRAALAVDDFHREHGWMWANEGLGPKPTRDLPARRAYDRARKAVEQLREARQRQGGRFREP